MQNQRSKLIELHQNKKYAEVFFKKAEAEYKELQSELINDAEDKFEIDGYKFSKVPRDTYKLKDGIDEGAIIAKYPSSAKLDTNKLFQYADKPESLLDVNHTEYFKITYPKETKSKEF